MSIFDGILINTKCFKLGHIHDKTPNQERFQSVLEYIYIEKENIKKPEVSRTMDMWGIGIQSMVIYLLLVLLLEHHTLLASIYIWAKLNRCGCCGAEKYR